MLKCLVWQKCFSDHLLSFTLPSQNAVWPTNTCFDVFHTEMASCSEDTGPCWHSSTPGVPPYQRLLIKEHILATVQQEGRETEAEEATGTLPNPSSKNEKKASEPSKRTSRCARPSRPGGFLLERPSSLHLPQALLILQLCKFQQGLRSHSQGPSE